MPKARDWVNDYFGESGETLLDDDVYSEEDIRRDKIKLRRERQRIEKEMNKFAKEYKELLQKGANADELKREQYAKQAKVAKKKYKVKKKAYQKNSVILGTVVTIEGARELQEMADTSSTELETIVSQGDVDVAGVQEEMREQMMQFDLDMGMMQNIQDELDMDIMTTEMSTDSSEELEMMEEMAAGDLDDEEIDVDDVDAVEDVEVNLDDDIDLDDEELNV